MYYKPFVGFCQSDVPTTTHKTIVPRRVMWYNKRDDTLKGVPAMLDIFDILGPVMIGPSNSHTAGAARIGAMARTLLGAPPVKAAQAQSGGIFVGTAGRAVHDLLRQGGG